MKWNSCDIEPDVGSEILIHQKSEDKWPLQDCYHLIFYTGLETMSWTDWCRAGDFTHWIYAKHIPKPA